jgi:hypothetical protein
MAEQDNGRTASLWRAFSIWPSPAIDAVLVRKSQAATLALAFLSVALAVVPLAAHSFAQAPLLVMVAALAAAALCSAISAVLPSTLKDGSFRRSRACSADAAPR